MTAVINAERLLSTFTELFAIDAEPTRERAMADRLTALNSGNIIFNSKGGQAAAVHLFHIDKLIETFYNVPMNRQPQMIIVVAVVTM